MLIRLIIILTFLSSIVSSCPASLDSYDVQYTVSVTGVDLAQFESLKKDRLLDDKCNRVSNIYALHDRIERFVRIAKQQFVEHGYYDASVSYSLSQQQEATVVNINVDLGTLYRISNVELQFSKKKDDKSLNSLRDTLQHKKFISSQIKKIATAFTVENIASWCERNLHKRGYPFAKVLSRNVVLDKINGSALIEIGCYLGEKIYYGPTRINGLYTLNESFVLKRTCWEYGDIFNIKDIERTNRLLTGSQIFSKVNISLDESNVQNGIAPVNIDLIEDKPRSLELSLFYSTIKTYNFQETDRSKKNLRSIYGSLTWIHYNVFRNGEKVRLSCSGAPFSVNSANTYKDYTFRCEFIKPDFFYDRDEVLSYTSYDRENKSAYYKLGRSIGCEWASPPWLLEYVKCSAGISFEENIVNGPYNILEKYECIYMPFIFSFDKRNSVLNPSKGYKISLKVVPQLMCRGRLSHLISLYCTQAFSRKQSRDTVLAVWGNFSKVFTFGCNDVPLDKRLYAGGVSSVRGYGLQMAGPMRVIRDSKNIAIDTKYPIGGLYKIECGAEIRKNIYKEIGGVIFFESAAVGNLNKIFSGYGVGLRYNTLIGPIRMDLAFPLKRRKNIDNRMQFYLSFGQAF